MTEFEQLRERVEDMTKGPWEDSTEWTLPDDVIYHLAIKSPTCVVCENIGGWRAGDIRALITLRNLASEFLGLAEASDLIQRAATGGSQKGIEAALLEHREATNSLFSAIRGEMTNERA